MKYKIAIIVISALVSILIHFPELIALVDDQPLKGYSPFANIRSIDVIVEVCYLFVTLILLFWFNTIALHFNDSSRKIKLNKVVLSFVGTWILNNLLGFAFIKMHQVWNIPAIDIQLHHYMHPLRDFVISSVVTGSCFIIHLVIKQQKIVLENQQLRAENLTNQYESLKNQLNPHMFFNCLNTLNSLIRESPQKAQKYNQELSKVLRYMLQPSNFQGVTLANELEFLSGYIYIIKSRYEDNLNFEIEINESLYNLRLPSMALQLLVENAVKHNEISSRNPLSVRIFSHKNFITVSNNVQPKINPCKGSGIGLFNLNKRYELLFKTNVEISLENGLFSVTLPLIKIQDNESFNN